MQTTHKKPQAILFTKQPYVEDTGPRRVKSMQFSMMSGIEIMKAAECQVHLGQYYDSNRKPIQGGLLDAHLGAANKNSTCETCGGSLGDCPGHFGYLSLVLPVYNIGFLGAIVDILKCICKFCSRILLDDELCKENLKKMRNPKADPLRKNDIMKNMVKRCSNIASSKVVKCWRCGHMNGTIKKGIGAQGIIHDRSKLGDGFVQESRSAIARTKEAKAPFGPATYIINPVHVLSLFKRIPDEDCELLCLCDRPEKLIITDITVPPIPIRPSVVDGSLSHENDVSERLKQIIQTNARLRLQLLEERKSNKYLESWDELQAVVALYINSDIRVPYNIDTGKSLSGFVQRLKGKQGRFRGNLCGKRVEYTGRTVISPDPNLKITEVAIPMQMAKILTYPECVSDHNIEKLRQCVKNGIFKYPGACRIKYPNGTIRALHGTFRKRVADELSIGYIVERHLEDGDVVLFNRQPSLHRMSIMCHRARIMPWRTLRFNESVCTPYNADFDGDEMNLHVPQTEEARTEALTLMGVQNNLCTPKNGEILVASTQDFLTTSFLITRKDTFFDRAAFSLLCSFMDDSMGSIDLPTPAILKPVELWTGKQVFSVLVRPNANVKVFLNLIVKEKTYSKPKKGEKREWETMCPNDGYVYFRNSELLSGQLGKATLGNGNKDGLFAVLLRDYNAHAATTCMNRLAKLSARWIGNHGFSIGIDDVQPGRKLHEQKEATIANGYEHCNNLIQQYNKGKLTLKPGCDAVQTLEAEITGILNNLREEAGNVCVKELHWRNSPLIMAQCGSKGSVINISQMIACVGQQTVGGHRIPDGFIDRSLPLFPRKSKTPEAKGFVANSFYSGLTATEFFFHTICGREGLVDTAVKTADTGYMSRRLIKGLEELSIQYDNTVRNSSGCILQFVYGDDGLDPTEMEGKDGFPLNLDRLILKAKALCGRGDDDYLSSSGIMEVMQTFLENEGSNTLKERLRSLIGDYVKRLGMTMKLFGVDKCSENMEGDDAEREINRNLQNFAHKISGITKRQLEVFFKMCFERLVWKKIEPGTAIGAIGAQSIGEPGTQMTLKTFHFAGVASMNITQGVPRIKEIINAAKKISTPIITAELDNDHNVNVARIVKSRIKRVTLGQVAKSIKIVITSRSASVRVTLDMKKIQEAQLSLDANYVKDCILQTARMKLKAQHIKVLNEAKLAVFPSGVQNQINFELHTLKNRLPAIAVKGLKTVDRVVIAQKTCKGDEDDQGGPKYNMFVEGTDLLAVMGTEGVNGLKTKSNHILEVRQTLGIEAARTCIIDEIKQTMEHHGMNIDIRHMKLLADVMTYRGDVLGITRYGVRGMDKSVLMLASFEQTADHLFDAAVNGREDKIEGVSECIIMGTPMQMGTGILKLHHEVDHLPELTYGLDPILS